MGRSPSGETPAGFFAFGYPAGMKRVLALVLAAGALLRLEAALAAPETASPAPLVKPPADWVGESFRWEVRYAGVLGGYAWGRVEADPGSAARVRILGGAENAPWYASVYTLQDRVVSSWDPARGSVRYECVFREGGFWQDLDMRFAPGGISVWHRQLRSAGWEEWTTPYPAAPGVEDPVSAFFRLRTMDGPLPWVFPVFSGTKTWPLQVLDAGKEHLEESLLGPVDLQLLEFRTGHDGDLEQRGRFVLAVTDDVRRIPMRMVVSTKIGPFRADLIAYDPPQAAR